MFGDAEAVHRVHPTQKPSKLLAMILERWTKSGTIIADPFAGSGSLIVACELTERVAHCGESDALYCDVICARYQGLTGIKPILEATGAPHDFLA